jgi:hypothetical protein
MKPDEQLASKLVNAWREFLVTIRDDIDDGGEGLGEFIDLLQELPPDSEPYDEDPPLRSLFGLIGGLNWLLNRAYETEAEHQLVQDAFADAMRLLAATLSERGHQIELPDVRPH